MAVPLLAVEGLVKRYTRGWPQHETTFELRASLQIDEPAIVGTAIIVKESYPDPTAWDKNDHHFDPASTPDNPRWFMVDIRLDQIFETPLNLASLRAVPALKKMELLRKGSRLSVQPVRKAEFEAILKLAK